MAKRARKRKPVGGAEAATITEVMPLPSDPNVRRVKAGGTIVARLSAGDVEALGIEVGKRWTAAMAKRAEQAAETTKARRAALTMLGRRAMSEGELLDRLIRHGHAQVIVQRVIDGLRADHWIDDEAYAVALAEELAAKKGASHAMVVERLKRRKIDESLASEVAQRVLGEVDQIEAATALARKRLTTMKGVAPDRAAARVASFLARRGYDEEVIADALRRIGMDVE